MRFLFWNIKQNLAVISVLNSILIEEDIDVLAIAECESIEASFTNQFCALSGFVKVSNPSGLIDKVIVYHKPSMSRVHHAHNGQHITVWEVSDPLKHDVYYAVFCHLPSKLYMDEKEQCSFAEDFVQEVVDFENSKPVDSVFICGDFNMNPFEYGMVYSKGFHSIMDKNFVKVKETRKVNQKQCKMFYNPMWRLMGGGLNKQPQGTYYRFGYQSVEYLWHTFDQIILRPSIVNKFDDSELAIITKGISFSLLNAQGKLDKRFSDHLPLKFKFNF